ncbi:DUF4199 domain-containing protein [Altererythrobacter sp. ZODW24]|uniref:DUF4199 domain-containing protein n=1 Tax=Altererythrobacter sp. ZODW24 TaxID=2185142 RepID=UPI000DF748AD|nr:DUF4199 domain-containing protein [Altererythrobacter sp. ZODW24]
MFRYAIIFGSIAGAVVVTVMSIVLSLMDPDRFVLAETLGYVTMIATLGLIFIGIKRYRDAERGGVISFAGAFGVGAAMSAVAAIVFALGWEVYMFATDYALTADYANSVIAAIEADTLSADEKARQIADVEAAVQLNRNPLFRFAISLIELFPVALIVSLISAFILKNPKVLPARTAG